MKKEIRTVSFIPTTEAKTTKETWLSQKLEEFRRFFFELDEFEGRKLGYEEYQKFIEKTLHSFAKEVRGEEKTELNPEEPEEYYFKQGYNLSLKDYDNKVKKLLGE